MDQFLGRILRRIHARNGISQGYGIPFFHTTRGSWWKICSPLTFHQSPAGTLRNSRSWNLRTEAPPRWQGLSKINNAKCMQPEWWESTGTATRCLQLFRSVLPEKPPWTEAPALASCSRGKRLSPPGSLRESREGSAICRPCRALLVFARTSQPSTRHVLSPAHIYSHAFSLVFLHVTSAFLYRIWPLDENLWLF